MAAQLYSSTGERRSTAFLAAAPGPVLWLAIFLSCLWGSTFSRAQGTLVVPNNLVGTEGNSLTDIGAITISRQTVYASGQFAAAGGLPILLTAVAFRMDAQVAAAQSIVIPEVTISLSTTKLQLAGLGNTMFNRGPDLQTVYSHQNVMLSAHPSGAASTAPFDIRFVFDQPFIYNPRSGQLVMDFLQVRPSPFQFLDVDAQQFPDPSNLPLRTVTDDLVGFPMFTNGGKVTAFSFEIVPEPTALVIGLLLGVLVFAVKFGREGGA